MSKKPPQLFHARFGFRQLSLYEVEHFAVHLTGTPADAEPFLRSIRCANNCATSNPRQTTTDPHESQSPWRW
jgi:hypothetical protein